MKKLLPGITTKVFQLTFLISLLFCNETRGAEGIPLIINYRHSDYRAETQNWSIVEDQRGFIYIANLGGVLEFDGSSWRLIRLPGNLYATSLAIDSNGIIYVGSYSEFGILQPDEYGHLHYNSLLHLFPAQNREFSFIWKIEATQDAVYFSNYDNLFRLHNDTITAWDISRLSSFFIIHNNLLVYDNAPNKGLMYLENDQLKRFDSENSLAGYYISGVFPYKNEKLLLYSMNKGLLVANNRFCQYQTHFNPVPLASQQVADFLHENIFTHGLQLQNGLYAFSTQNAGVVIMNDEGIPETVLNESMGLQNETVNSMFLSSDQILWLALDNGVTSANANLGISFWNNQRGIKGSVISIARHGQKIYAGTWQGVYEMDTRNNLVQVLNHNLNDFPASFRKIESIEGIGWRILLLQRSSSPRQALLIATSSGLWLKHFNQDPVLIHRGHFYDVLQSQHDPSLIIAAGGSGLLLFKLDQNTGQLDLIEKHEDLRQYEIYKIVEDKNLRFWLVHRKEGISRLSIQNRNNQYGNQVQHFNAAHGLYPKGDIMAFNLGGKVLFISEGGLQQFQPSHRRNNRTNAVNRVEFKSVDYVLDLLLRRFISIRFVKVDRQLNIWLQIQNRNTRNKKVVKLEYNPERQTYQLKNNAYNFFAGHTINDMLVEQDNTSMWFAADDAVFYYKKNPEKPSRSFCCFLRSISVNNQWVPIPDPHTQHQIKEISHRFSFRENNISFQYSIANSLAPEQSLYSTKLVGIDTEWSAWSQINEKHYTSLPPGHYTFYARGQDASGNISSVAEYHFQIRPPWYLRSWAYIIYMMVLICFTLIITKAVNKNLIRAKLRLEAKIRERTREIEEKQKQIEEERKNADQLLQNILPAKIASELKTKGEVKVQYYDLVTIMFLDFKDFSKISQFINPLALISELNNSFCMFDEIAQKNRLEKIKTIGDAYMCAGGIPEANLTNPFDTILAAFDILNFIQNAEKEQWLCDVRIGIHTGDIMAGVIGKNKFAYDIWGESVNTASRMEQKGEVNRINISGETYELVKDFFNCEYRGKLEAKHQNQFDMYFVNRIKAEYSRDAKGTVANEKFWNDVNEYLSRIPVS